MKDHNKISNINIEICFSKNIIEMEGNHNLTFIQFRMCNISQELIDISHDVDI